MSKKFLQLKPLKKGKKNILPTKKCGVLKAKTNLKI